LTQATRSKPGTRALNRAGFKNYGISGQSIFRAANEKIIQTVFFKNLKLIIFIFLDCLDVRISKIIFKKIKKYYFDAFLIKNNR
jgi:hypothetical protein